MFGLLVLLFYCLISIDGHGYLFEPVARSSAWLVDSSFRECCTWPQHMEMFCGGLGHQWRVNDGKCSICGEPYDKEVKLFEKGGARYTGKIVQTYRQGQQIDVKVMLTANHKGYFEFRLCNLDASPLADATQECLDRHQLIIADTNSTKFRNVSQYGSEMITVRVQLPSNVACSHCVFQWKYTAGNSWGTDSITGQSGAGLGRENETFMGCSDITILPDGSPTDPPMVIIPSTSAFTTTTRKSTTTSTMRTSSSTHWSLSSTTGSTGQWTWSSSTTQRPTSSTTRSTISWTWPSTTSQRPTSSTTGSTISWTWPSTTSQRPTSSTTGSTISWTWPSTTSQRPTSSTAGSTISWTWPSTTSQRPTSSTTGSTISWTWPSTTSQRPTLSTTRSTVSWTWPSLSSGGSLSPSTATTRRPPLGLTTWSSDFFEYQKGDEVMYDGIKYRCVAPHRSYLGAEPGILTWAWWTPVQEEENF